MVAHNTALLALLVSNNFVEIESNVFKRYGRDDVHSLLELNIVVLREFHLDPYFGSSMINPLVKSSNLDEARKVFDQIPERDLFVGIYLLEVMCRNASLRKQSECFCLLVSLIQGYSQSYNLESGKILHACIIRKGLESNIILSFPIVDMYAKRGAAKQAASVFGKMKERNVITWAAMRVGLSKNGYAEDALKFSIQMSMKRLYSFGKLKLFICCHSPGGEASKCYVLVEYNKS
ncbi:hypothetical protein K1719_004225 [Acacia pycnantha]|nr:hypothetical protein K1719_004225 [Acacia pycnantha]